MFFSLFATSFVSFFAFNFTFYISNVLLYKNLCSALQPGFTYIRNFYLTNTVLLSALHIKYKYWRNYFTLKSFIWQLTILKPN